MYFRLFYEKKCAKQGASSSIESRAGHTALTWVAVCGFDLVAAELLGNRTSVDDAVNDVTRATNLEGKTALHHAAFNGNPSIVVLFLDRLRNLLLRNRWAGEGLQR